MTFDQRIRNGAAIQNLLSSMGRDKMGREKRYFEKRLNFYIFDNQYFDYYTFPEISSWRPR